MNNTQLGIMLRLYHSKLIDAIGSTANQLPDECFRDVKNILGYKTRQCDALEDLYEVAAELQRDAEELIKAADIECGKVKNS